MYETIHERVAMNLRTFAAVGIVVSSIALACTLAADEPANNEFAGKVIVVFQNTESKHPTHIVVDSSLQVIGGRVFLVGKGADTNRKKDWRSGMKIGISWDSVTTYNVLTPSEFKQYLNDDAEVESRPGGSRIQ